jgi:hypothetical protein
MINKEFKIIKNKGVNNYVIKEGLMVNRKKRGSKIGKRKKIWNECIRNNICAGEHNKISS